MKTKIIQSLTNNFESYAHKTENGVEFWLARDLQQLLGYDKWDNFIGVISKAKIACENTGHLTADHFADAGKTIFSRNISEITSSLHLTCQCKQNNIKSLHYYS
jgi:DNA-damage-inducible protein D